MSTLEFLGLQCGYTHARLLPSGRWAAIHPLLFTHAILTGRENDHSGYEDRWCYHDFASALAALIQWDGTGEPDGWHRHPKSGRRREAGVETISR